MLFSPIFSSKMGFIILSVLAFFGLDAPNPALATTNSQGNRIIGGSPTLIGQVPYQVSLHTNHGEFVCGGSIISKNHVVTAAHCAPYIQNGFVRAGSIRVKEGGILSYITEIKAHQNYIQQLPTRLRNDIAILRVEPEFIFDDTIKPIELYDGDLDQAAANEKTTVVSGFGKTKFNGVRSEVLMTAQVPIVNRKTCSRYYSQVGFGAVGDDRFCAGDNVGGHSTCHGDSGGPLVMDGRLIGIVSYGYVCGMANYPGVNTNVAYYIEWIQKNIKENDVLITIVPS